MTDINTVILIGRLTRDVQDRDWAYTPNDTARLNLSLAINRSEKKAGEWADKASFFDVVVWGKKAESIKPYIQRGKQIAVSGWLDQQRWEKDGQKFSKIVIVAEQIQLLGGKDKSETPVYNSEEYTETDEAEEIPF